MKELKCPQCGSVFSVDEADYASIVSQVKTQEFDAEIKVRLAEIQKQNESCSYGNGIYKYAVCFRE